VDPAILADIVKRVVEAGRPEKIVLFGSAARGEMGSYWRVIRNTYRYLSGKGAPVDIVLTTPEDVERFRDSHCLAICPAMREGKVIYDAQAVSAGRPTRMARAGTWP
jgi:hypothetical protein